MKFDSYGRGLVSQRDLVDLLYRNPDLDLSGYPVIDPTSYNHSIDLLRVDYAKLTAYQALTETIEQFDHNNQQCWFMPPEYREHDIAQWVLEQCEGPAELQRAGEELLMYQERNLFDLLNYLKYLVDTMREHNIVWGVGRGSSVASFVLYKIGVHKINSLYYDLDITEFLKDEA